MTYRVTVSAGDETAHHERFVLDARRARAGQASRSRAPEPVGGAGPAAHLRPRRRPSGHAVRRARRARRVRGPAGRRPHRRDRHGLGRRCRTDRPGHLGDDRRVRRAAVQPQQGCGRFDPAHRRAGAGRHPRRRVALPDHGRLAVPRPRAGSSGFERSTGDMHFTTTCPTCSATGRPARCSGTAVDPPVVGTARTACSSAACPVAAAGVTVPWSTRAPSPARRRNRAATST